MADSNPSALLAAAVFQRGVEHLRDFGFIDTMPIDMRLASLLIEIEANGTFGTLVGASS